MNPYKFKSIKTIGLNDGRWEVLLDDGSFLSGVTSIELLKEIGQFGKATISILLPEDEFKVKHETKDAS